MGRGASARLRPKEYRFVVAVFWIVLMACCIGVGVWLLYSRYVTNESCHEKWEGEERKLWLAAIDSLGIARRDGEEVVLAGTTVGSKGLTVAYLNERLKESIDPRLQSAILSFLKEDSGARTLGKWRGIEEDIVLLSEEEVLSIGKGKLGWSDEAWREFYRRHPRAVRLIRMSKCGFDVEKGVGVMYMEWQSGMTVGEGWLLMLRRDQERWNTIWRALVCMW